MIVPSFKVGWQEWELSRQNSIRISSLRNDSQTWYFPNMMQQCYPLYSDGMSVWSYNPLLIGGQAPLGLDKGQVNLRQMILRCKQWISFWRSWGRVDGTTRQLVNTAKCRVCRARTTKKYGFKFTDKFLKEFTAWKKLARSKKKKFSTKSAPVHYKNRWQQNIYFNSENQW
jgi:hypothetical protein